MTPGPAESPSPDITPGSDPDVDSQVVLLEPAFAARMEVEDGVAVVKVHGDVDLAARDEMWAVIEEALAYGDRLAIDLGHTTFLDSIGLNMIVRASNERGPDLERIVLRAPSEAVCKLLRITGVDRLVIIEPRATSADATD